ncbi:MAG: tetraacyldisaccharide 4'-kinase [Deltaproteobacteria bacterium]|nr:tetraacyldisaccharide 4'-kinase [Deltaproteobacteria bacterium]
MKRMLAALYGLGGALRNAGYDSRLLPVNRIDGAVVISVGNLRAGGSGKSPLALYLAKRMAEMGRSPALLLRGYRGRMEHRGGVVSRGEGMLVDAELAGDEAVVAARRLDGVIVRVGADRVASARAAVADSADAIVLDDGFQHRRIHRDLDLLLVAPEDLDPATRRLPAGPLRELADSAERADLLIGLMCDWQGRDDAPDVLLEYSPTGLVDSAWNAVSVDEQRGARVHLLAGIARPDRFVETAKDAGFEVCGTSFFPDHHRFDEREIQRVEQQARAAGAELILTTEKDLARLEGLETSLPLRALRVDVRVVRGERLLDRFLRSALR